MRRITLRIGFVVATCFCVLVIAFAQPKSLAGKYEGSVNTPNGDVTLKLDLSEDAGKYSGRVTLGDAAYSSAGQIVDGVLTLNLAGEMSADGVRGKMTLREKENKLIGEFSIGARSGPVELHRIPKDEISGEWDAAADAQGQAFPFTLSLKLDGEKVTGSSSSQLGNSQISTGSWKDGRLSLVLDSGSGPIGLVATLDGDKLIGDYDYAGQLQGKWVAVRKK